jgi:prepilin-type N-terminal cleavage/methylation domain-containing protein
MKTRTRSAFSLVEILVVMALMAILGAFLFQFYAGKGKPGEKQKTPMQASQGAVCQNNLKQIRLGVETFKTSEEEKPPTFLAELKFPKESLACPDTKQTYQYNAETGEVHCTTPGHEAY